MVKCLLEFEYFHCDLEKKNIFFSKIRRSKVTDHAALINWVHGMNSNLSGKDEVANSLTYTGSQHWYRSNLRNHQ